MPQNLKLFESVVLKYLLKMAKCSHSIESSFLILYHREYLGPNVLLVWSSPKIFHTFHSTDRCRNYEHFPNKEAERKSRAISSRRNVVENENLVKIW